MKQIFRKVGSFLGDAVVGTVQGVTGTTEEKLAELKRKRALKEKREKAKTWILSITVIVVVFMLLDIIRINSADNTKVLQTLQNHGVILLIPILICIILIKCVPFIIKPS